MKTKSIVALGAVVALMMIAPTAWAQTVTPNLGLQVTATDPATRTVGGLQHCTSPDRAGRPAQFKVAADIDFSQFRPGAMRGIAVDAGGVILSTGDMPCTAAPQGPTPGGPTPGGPTPGGPVPGGPVPAGPVPPGAVAPGAERPQFNKGFLNRVWKFAGEIDSFESGKLTITVGKVLNVPKKFAAQDDELVDEDAIVLINGKVRIYDEHDKRIRQRELSDADEKVRVSGKLLPPDKWEKDDDGQSVTTIRAKKIYLLG